MINYKPKSGDIELWLISKAIEDCDLVDKMERDEDGSYPIVFSVGGVELDFHKVAKIIDDIINNTQLESCKKLDELVTDKAISLLHKKYGDILDSIAEIEERLNNQRDRFKYDWETDKS